MSTNYKCDRCGAGTLGAYLSLDNHRHAMTIRYGDRTEWDLCGPCMAGFRTWIREPAATTGGMTPEAAAKMLGSLGGVPWWETVLSDPAVAIRAFTKACTVVSNGGPVRADEVYEAARVLHIGGIACQQHSAAGTRSNVDKLTDAGLGENVKGNLDSLFKGEVMSVITEQHLAVIADRIARAAKSGREFDADMIREQLPIDVRVALAGDRTTLGNAFQSAKQHGVIEKVGYTLSRSPARKSGVIRTWRGIAQPKPNAAKGRPVPAQPSLFDMGGAA